MNLLAAAATFGVMTALFQWGWGIGAFGLGTAGPVESFLPVFILPILFGLSTDYQVFLVSRMSEEWARSGDSHRAVRAGQVGTARVIHRRRRDHDVRVPGVLPWLRQPAQHRRVRHQPHDRGRPRRVRPAYRVRPRPHAHVRRRQLAASSLAGDPAPHLAIEPPAQPVPANAR